MIQQVVGLVGDQGLKRGGPERIYGPFTDNSRSIWDVKPLKLVVYGFLYRQNPTFQFPWLSLSRNNGTVELWRRCAKSRKSFSGEILVSPTPDKSKSRS